MEEIHLVVTGIGISRQHLKGTFILAGF